MHIRRSIFAVLALCLVWALPAYAAEPEETVPCFSGAVPEGLRGICITAVPAEGTLLLGDRVLSPGDVLTAEQMARTVLSAQPGDEDTVATVTYLPIYDSYVAPPAVLTLSIRAKQDRAPAASDSAVETYKNLPLEGQLTVKDPEGQPMTFTLVRDPRRGEVTIREDGSFTYTPRKNKVGVDSFTYTATDAAGNVSREATVTVTVLKTGSTEPYTDTLGQDCRFAAEWMKNTGIFVAESLDGNRCFRPEAQVSRGQFVTMLVNALELKVDETVTYTGYTDEIPQWLRPYVAAAVRAGLTAGLPLTETFGADAVISGAEAAVMLQNALDLTAVETAADADAPAPAAPELLSRYGIHLTADPLTRGEAAQALYRAAKLADEAPGTLAVQAAQ